LWFRARYKDKIDITYAEAMLFYNRFRNHYRGLARYQAQARNRADLSHVIEVRTLVIERRMWLGDTWWKRYTSLLNEPIQGSGAEMQKISMCEADEQLRGKAELINCVHDELVMLCKAQDAKFVRDKLQEIMEDASEYILSGKIRIPAEVRIVDAWSDKKDKVFLPPPLPEKILYPAISAARQQEPDPAGISLKAVNALYDDAHARGVSLEIVPSSLEWPAEIAELRPLTNLEAKFRWERGGWAIWQARQRGIPPNSLNGAVDPLQVACRFCYPSRVLDAISQHVVRIARAAGDLRELVPQVLLLKAFNEWPAYQKLCELIGGAPNADNLGQPERLWKELNKAKASGELSRLWRPAYLVGKGHKALFDSVVRMIREGVADRIAACKDLYAVTDLLRSFPSVGDFHASQWAIDLSYSTFLSGKLEDFTWAGPGACAGVALWFEPRSWSWSSVNNVLRLLTKHQEACYQLVNGEPAPRLAGRLAFAMDTQNNACETQKFLLRPANLRIYRGDGGKQDPPLLPKWW
jgi:hypothetical protein